MVHPVPNPTGRTRMSFARIKEVANMPNLIEIQLDSYNWFLKEGLDEVFDDISAITNHGGNLILRFVGFHLDRDNIKYSIEECKERDATYAAPFIGQLAEVLLLQTDDATTRAAVRAYLAAKFAITVS